MGIRNRRHTQVSSARCAAQSLNMPTLCLGSGPHLSMSRHVLQTLNLRSRRTSTPTHGSDTATDFALNLAIGQGSVGRSRFTPRQTETLQPFCSAKIALMTPSVKTRRTSCTADRLLPRREGMFVKSDPASIKLAQAPADFGATRPVAQIQPCWFEFGKLRRDVETNEGKHSS